MARLGRRRTGSSRRNPRTSDDRGQLILLAAFALAVTFVALALVVNSAIYTENLASRGEGGASGDALAERHGVEQQLGDVVRTVNVHNATSLTALEGAVEGAVANVSTVAGTQQAARGRFLSLSSVGHEEGTRIADNASGGSTFEGASGADRWTVAATGATRAFVLEIDRASVTGGSETFGGPRDDEFEINVTDGTDVWLLNVTDRSDEVTVGVDGPGSIGGTCTAPPGGTPVELDLTAGTVGGRECPAVTFAEGVSGNYDVEYNNSQLVTGNYSLVIDRDSYGTAELQSGPTVGDPGDPYARVALYATTIRYRYDAPTVHYETDVRVAPGEHDG